MATDVVPLLLDGAALARRMLDETANGRVRSRRGPGDDPAWQPCWLATTLPR